MKNRNTVQSSATSYEVGIQTNPCRESALGGSLPATQSLKCHTCYTRCTRVDWQALLRNSWGQICFGLLKSPWLGQVIQCEDCIFPSICAQKCVTHHPAISHCGPTHPIPGQCMLNSGCGETARRPSAAETYVGLIWITPDSCMSPHTAKH